MQNFLWKVLIKDFIKNNTTISTYVEFSHAATTLFRWIKNKEITNGKYKHD